MIYRTIFVLCGVLIVGLLVWLNITSLNSDGWVHWNEQGEPLAIDWLTIGLDWRIGLVYAALGLVLGLLMGGRLYALGNKFDYNGQLKKLASERDRAHEDAHASFEERNMAVTRAQRRSEQINYLANCKLKEAQRLTTLMEEKERQVYERLERAINKHQDAELSNIHKLLAADHRKSKLQEMVVDHKIYD